MKLNLNKDYLNTIDNSKIIKTIRHYYHINNNNYYIDNNNNTNIKNNGKYKYASNRLNTNDYFKLHKKNINNYNNHS